jgi:hypothetical protein
MAAKLTKYYNIWTALAIFILFLAVYHFTFYPWMNQWGLTNAQAGMALPGDGTEAGTVIASTRGVTIHAPAAVVWQWLVQVGQDQAGFYSNDWLENLFLADIHNNNALHPEWQSHQKGDAVFGAGGAIYQRNYTWSTPAFQDGKMLYLWGPLVVLPLDEQSSLLLARSYAKSETFINEITYGWIHFVMERGMLLGIKTRAEGTLNASIVLQIISQIGWVVTTLAMALLLFWRRRGWWWGLIPLAYAAAITAVTADIWSAMAGFLWWGVITAGFMLFGRRWWKSLILIIALVISIFVLTPQPQMAFGTIFLLITLTSLTLKVYRHKFIG